MYDGFDDKNDVARRFDVELPDTIDILIAAYWLGDYQGNAIVVYRDSDGRLWEVNGSHCSCYGLEGQWHPEEVVVEELLKRYRYVGDDDAINTKIRDSLVNLIFR